MNTPYGFPILLGRLAGIVRSVLFFKRRVLLILPKEVWENW